MRGSLFSDLESIDDELRNVVDPGNAMEEPRVGKPYHLSPSIYKALRSREPNADRYIVSLYAFDHQGIRFRPHSVGPKDSHVVF